MTRITILAITAGLLSCQKVKDDPVDCQNEESARNMVPTDDTPDWQIELEFTADELGLEREDASNLDTTDQAVLREHIEAWDCLDLAWWNPSQPRKVVQIWSDETDCALYERASVEYFGCDSHDGEDDVYRDTDGDGFYSTEGDCDDEDGVSFPDAEEICDEIDNNCNGLIDEDLNCDEFSDID
jgi:hypothetical protein